MKPAGTAAVIFFSVSVVCLPAAKHPFESADLVRLRAVGEVALSPDTNRVAYTVVYHDGPDRPYSRIWIRDLQSGALTVVGSEREPGSGPRWSPDGHWLAYEGKTGERSGLLIVRPDGSGVRFLAPIQSTNSRMPETGKRLAWSPDSKQIAFLSALPGPEAAAASGDPMVITRYLYRPDASDGVNPFSDNRRLHIFMADLGGAPIRQLTDGPYHEHSIDWSPRGDEILFVSNREPDPDRFFNNDIFALKVTGNTIRRLTATESSEYRPRWSPDGNRIVFQATRRGVTYLDAVMEDMHLWMMDASGNHAHELTAAIDNRQGEPFWNPEGTFVYFTVQEKGSVHLYRIPASGGIPELAAGGLETVGSWSVGRDGTIAYSFSGTSDLAQLYLKSTRQPVEQLTALNAELLNERTLGSIENFTFVSHDHTYEIEAFLTKPVVLNEDAKYPLIVNIHGGPHGQQGPAFDFSNQVYAGRGWATLMVNYRGSTGYGQKFADAIFGDQHGAEAQDVLYGTSAAIRRYLWLDRDQMGVEGVSYGGFICALILTQSGLFKAAVSTAGITNPVTYNYRTNNNQYVHMAYGTEPHQENLMDRLWQSSPLRFIAGARTPTLLMHGENDSDVPIAETEQLYIALKDVGVETVMVRYPREGHGIREVRHRVDSLDRSIRWFESHFAGQAHPR
jgi:dipeptidyl aminopeptidase/acylaminoacyl peptidase